MRRGVVALVLLLAAVLAVVLGGGRAEQAAPVRAAVAPPVEPCSAGTTPTSLRGGRAEIGPVIVLGTPALRRARPGRVAMEVLVAPGVPVRLRIDGGARFDRRYAACAPTAPFDRPEPTLGHRRAVPVELDVARRGCVRVTAEVEGGALVSRWLGIGRRCARSAPAGGIVAACHHRVEPAVDREQPGITRLGPLGVIAPAAVSTARVRPPIVLKFPAVVDAGAVVTVRVAAPALLRTAGAHRGARTVTYIGCPEGEPLFSREQGVVGPATGHAGDLTLPAPGCVALEARTPGRPAMRTRFPVGVARCG